MLKKPMLKLIEAIKSTGLVVVSEKNHGKTNATMCILASMKQEIPCVIDFATQHCFKLGSRFEVKFLNERYLIKKPRVTIEQPIIIDVSQCNKQQASEIIRNLIKSEYLERVKEVISNFRNGEKREVKQPWIVFACEESQSIIGRYLKKDSDLFNAVACGRNYKLNFLFTTQRLSDLNASLVERCSYLIGKIKGDNNLRKIGRILGLSRKKLKFIETLKKGQFVLFTGDRIETLQFPKFEGSKAYEVKAKILYRKKKNLWKKLKDAFTNNHEETLEEMANRHDREDELEDSEEEGSYPIFDDDFV